MGKVGRGETGGYGILVVTRLPEGLEVDRR